MVAAQCHMRVWLSPEEGVACLQPHVRLGQQERSDPPKLPGPFLNRGAAQKLRDGPLNLLDPVLKFTWLRQEGGSPVARLEGLHRWSLQHRVALCKTQLGLRWAVQERRQGVLKVRCQQYPALCSLTLLQLPCKFCVLCLLPKMANSALEAFPQFWQHDGP